MNIRSLPVLVAISIVFSSALSGADGDSQKESELKKAAVRAILEAGQAANSLPEGVFVRVEAQLIRSGTETKRHGAGPEKIFRETWEFTSNHVHRVVVESAGKNGGDTTHRRVESLPFDTNGICKELLDANILTLGEEGKGERQHFVGTDYDVGHRAIQVFLNGKSALYVGESCLVVGYAASDARAFAALYEKLAAKARGAFEANSVRNVQKQ